MSSKKPIDKEYLVNSLKDFDREILSKKYLNLDTIYSTEQNLEDIPIGTIIPYMGNQMPANYLLCDGTIYSKTDYPDLVRYIVEEFGSADYFGGDGINTFAVPDLRGEFLRGAGTAARDTGNGSDVGQHQDPTTIPNIYYYPGTCSIACNNDSGGFTNPDKTFKSKNDGINGKYHVLSDAIVSGYTRYTVRPTNTSVKWCIKSEHTYYVRIQEQFNITDEQLEQMKEEIKSDLNGSNENTSVAISRISGNQLEEKEDGLYVPPCMEVDIDTNNDNAIKQNENGLYVKDLEPKLIESQEKLATITQYQKFVNTELEYICLRMDLSIEGPYKGMLPFTQTCNGNMTINENGTVTLHAGKVYSISAGIYALTKDPASTVTVRIVDAATNTTLDNHSIVLIGNGYNSTCTDGLPSITMLYKAIKDTDICMKVNSNDNVYLTLINGNSYFNIVEIARPTIIDPLGYSTEPTSMEDNPIGHLIRYLGNMAPKHYLRCDGSLVNVADYPYLAQHFTTVYGVANHFGGDGTTQIQLPNIRNDQEDEIICIKVEPTYFMHVGDRLDVTNADKEAIATKVKDDLSASGLLHEPINEEIFKTEATAASIEACKDIILSGFQQVLDEQITYITAFSSNISVSKPLTSQGFKAIIENNTNGIALTPQGYIPLIAGKRYQIMLTCSANGKNNSSGWESVSIKNITTGDKLASVFITCPVNGGVQSGHCSKLIVYAPSKDCVLGYDIDNGTLVSTVNVNATVIELKQPVVNNIHTEATTEQIIELKNEIINQVMGENNPKYCLYTLTSSINLSGTEQYLFMKKNMGEIIGNIETTDNNKFKFDAGKTYRIETEVSIMTPNGVEYISEDMIMQLAISNGNNYDMHQYKGRGLVYYDSESEQTGSILLTFSSELNGCSLNYFRLEINEI